MRTHIGSIFLSTLIASFSAHATVTQYAITYQGSAFESQDKELFALVEASHAKALLERAEFVYRTAKVVYLKGAGAAFDLSNAAIQLINAKFVDTRAAQNLAEAKLQEKAHLLQMEWELGTRKQDLVELAELYVQLRENRNAMAEALLKTAEGPYRELKFQNERLEDGLAKGSVSRDEYNSLNAGFHEAERLVELAKRAVEDSKKQVEAAKRTAEQARKEADAKKNGNGPATTTSDGKK